MNFSQNQPPEIKVELKDREVRRFLKRTEGRLDNMAPAWNNVHAYMIRVITEQFDRSKRGGTARGVNWEYFKHQYIRKTDGTVVPAWGGVPRLIMRNSDGGGYMKLGRWIGVNRPNYVRTGEARRAAKGVVLGRLRSKTAGGKKRVRKGDSIMQSTGLMRNGVLSKMKASAHKVEMSPKRQSGKIKYQNQLRPFMFFEDPKDVNYVREQVINFVLGGK